MYKLLSRNLPKFILILFSTVFLNGCFEDPNKEANKLLNKTVVIIQQAEAEADVDKKQSLYLTAKNNLDQIIEKYPGSSVAVQLSTTGEVGKVRTKEIESAANTAVPLNTSKEIEKISVKDIVSGYDLSSDLDRAEAEQIIQEQTLYPAEIVKPILSYETTQYVNRLKPYAARVNNTMGATATIIGEGFKGWKELVVEPNDTGELFVRGEEEIGGYKGSHKYLPVVVYTVNLGEVTGIAFQNKEKTLAIVEYTEIYTPSLFTTLSEDTDDGKPRYSTEKRSVVLRLYDDGWRRLEDLESKEIDKKRTAPPEGFSIEELAAEAVDRELFEKKLQLVLEEENRKREEVARKRLEYNKRLSEAHAEKVIRRFDYDRGSYGNVTKRFAILSDSSIRYNNSNGRQNFYLWFGAIEKIIPTPGSDSISVKFSCSGNPYARNIVIDTNDHKGFIDSFQIAYKAWAGKYPQFVKMENCSSSDGGGRY